MAKIIKGVDCPDEDYKKNDVLFKEGEKGNCFYLLKAGKVAIFKDYRKGQGTLLAEINAGQVFGEISAFDALPRTATAVAASDVKIVKVNAQTLGYQMKQCPAWFRAIISELVARLRKTDELLKEKGIDNTHALSSLEETHSEEDEAETKNS